MIVLHVESALVIAKTLFNIYSLKKNNNSIEKTPLFNFETKNFYCWKKNLCLHIRADNYRYQLKKKCMKTKIHVKLKTMKKVLIHHSAALPKWMHPMEKAWVSCQQKKCFCLDVYTHHFFHCVFFFFSGTTAESSCLLLLLTYAVCKFRLRSSSVNSSVNSSLLVFISSDFSSLTIPEASQIRSIQALKWNETKIQKILNKIIIYEKLKCSLQKNTYPPSSCLPPKYR